MKKISILGIILTILAMAVVAHAQCASGSKDIQVMCIKGDGKGGECHQIGAGDCCGGMGHACMVHQGACHHNRGGCEMNFYLCCADEMELSEAQIKRLKTIRFEYKKSTIRMRADLDIMELELKQLLHKTDPDRSAVSKKVSAMGELKTKMNKEHILTSLDARSVLTKEQLEKCMSGHGGCCGKGLKKVIEHTSCSKEGKCSEEGKKCSDHGK